MKKEELDPKTKRMAIAGLVLLIVIGGLILFGKQGPRFPKAPNEIPHIKGPTTPPPGYR